MASTDTSSNSRHNDEEHDQIGSGTSTPPGAATPRPDLIDKRLPGILNTYFGQVRNPFRIPSWSPSALASATTFPDSASQDGSHESGHEAERKEDDSGLPTAPSSPLSVAAESHASPPLLPHEKPARSHKRKSISPQQFYPTPPLSSASSMHKVEEPASGTERAEENTDLPRARSNTHVRGATRRRDYAGTQGARRRSQNTPPQTPRALSHETKDSVPASARNGVADSSSKKSRSSSGGSSAPTIGSIKGQLSIQVVEARGLRPSTNPYVVCIFQANEDISDGPKNDEADTRPANGQLGEEDLARGVAMRRLGSDAGKSIAIPMRSRQSSSTNIAEMGRSKERETTNPVWNHKALFDVVGANNEVDISVYDKSNQEAFIGHVRFNPVLSEYEKPQERWFKLEPREGEAELVTGEAHLKIQFHKIEKRVYGPEDFQILKLIGKGTFGQVFQVRKKDTQRIYAMKVLSKKVIVQKKEIAHTIGERNILVRTAMTESPFIVGLKFSFQTPQDLYLVTDYMSGGELFWHLQKEGRFVESRAKFYIAELILALRHLHDHDIVYRDLKPENILLDANGHIALCDFGLSKANLTKNSTTNTFCGTTEYLAPEVLLDEHGYNKMVDFWSLGVLVFE
ncbi:Serine/threonine-protein kinase, partial [Elasticomyces elasticus]